ncbi:MAG TPA: hypothetical protein VH599_15580 [Ktedonobacterales bacterium]
MSGSVFSFDVGLGASVKKYLVAVDNDVDQYRSTLNTQVNDLLNSWQSPNKQSFIDDWTKYSCGMDYIHDAGPRLVAGLTHEIDLINQAEQVGF